MQTVQKHILPPVEYLTVFKEIPIPTDIDLPDPPIRYKLSNSDSEFLNPFRLDMLPDFQLIDMCRRKNEEAFNVFIRRYERRIYNRAYGLAGNAEDAHDIAAESRLRIYQYIYRFRNSITLRAWINRIVTNVFIDANRKTRLNTHVSLDNIREQSNHSPVFGFGEVAHSPHAQVEADERAAIVNQAIDALPNSLGLAFSLYYYKGRSYEQIACILNVPIGTVKSRLSRARISLRQRLSSLLPDLQ